MDRRGRLNWTVDSSTHSSLLVWSCQLCGRRRSPLDVRDTWRSRQFGLGFAYFCLGRFSGVFCSSFPLSGLVVRTPQICFAPHASMSQQGEKAKGKNRIGGGGLPRGWASMTSSGRFRAYRSVRVFLALRPRRNRHGGCIQPFRRGLVPRYPTDVNLCWQFLPVFAAAVVGSGCLGRWPRTDGGQVDRLIWPLPDSFRTTSLQDVADVVHASTQDLHLCASSLRF